MSSAQSHWASEVIDDETLHVKCPRCDGISIFTIAWTKKVQSSRCPCCHAVCIEAIKVRADLAEVESSFNQILWELKDRLANARPLLKSMTGRR